MDGGALSPQQVCIAPSAAAGAFDAALCREAAVFLILPGSDPEWIDGLVAFAAEEAFGERRIVVVGEDPFLGAPAAVRKRCIWISAGFSERAALAFAAGVAGAVLDVGALARIGFPDDMAIRLAIRTFEDVERYGRFLATLFSLSPEMSIGVRELLINAVEYGNLEILGTEKTDLLNAGTYFDEIIDRLGSPRYADRYALLHVHCQGGLLRFRIVDSGDGFDWRAVVGREITASDSRHQRGIVLAEAAGFSAFRYVGKGNEVIVEIALGS
jgi:hypothetical protein